MRVDRSFVLIEASQSVEEGLELVRQHPDVHFVILRREESGKIYWYSYRADRFLADMEGQPPTSTLKLALDMHEYTSKPQHREGSTDEATFVPGAVVLNARGRLVGVLEVVEMASPPPPSPSSELGRFGMPSPPRRREWGNVGLPSPQISRETPEEPPTLGPSRHSGAIRPTARTAPPAFTPPAGAPVPTAAEPVSHSPFAAWPDLAAPERVEPWREFELGIGFARQAQSGVSGGPVAVVDAPPEFDLRVQVVGVGFHAPDGWVYDLHVVRDDPYTARLKVKLVAGVSETRIETRTLSVLFYFESNLCGQAQRSIVVAWDSESAVDLAAASRPPATSVPIRVKPGLRAPDLTVTVQLESGHGWREAFVWSFESPHAIPIPETPPITVLDQNAGAFVDALLEQLVDLSDDPTADNVMRGIARQIARKVPPAVWIALKEVGRTIASERRAPDVLFVTEETRLPWELSWMPEPLDPARPNHLGAQVNFGRWILGTSGPPLPPEDTLPWHDLVVVVGNYPASSGLALPHAVTEARAIQGRAPAHTPIELNGADLDPFLEGDTPPNGAEIVHFACHGAAQSGNLAASSLTMQDGKRFTPATLEGSEIGGKWGPFLFLNACEVGRAGSALGETAGFAGAALHEGFRAFIGPLWKVDSRLACEIAINFYARTLDQCEPVASVLRDVRSKYTYRGANAAPSPDTYLAYVYYGHPALRFVRQP